MSIALHVYTVKLMNMHGGISISLDEKCMYVLTYAGKVMIYKSRDFY